ncbi:MAG: hypothetical protein LLF97_06300 [Planctomycetaceae bacterium]|nr:hypothetical protein [Planctomycetaceae bacterium]
MQGFWPLALTVLLWAADPPTINPFGPPAATRDDALPGRIQLSDGTTFRGRIYLTRDHGLKIYDESSQRQREVPLRSVRQIDCRVKQERMEREWRFKETASDQKLYTGRSYPQREYVHTITLTDGRTLTGPMSAVVYLDPNAGPKNTKTFLLHQRDKGAVGKDLSSLVYVKTIKIEAPNP